MAFLGGFFDPPASKVPTPQINTYQPTGFSAAEQGVLGGVGNLGQYNTYGQYLPQAQQITQNLVNDPYAGGYQQGAVQAGQMGQGAAQNAYGAGGSLYGQGGNLFGLGNSIAQTAFDPQNALYNRTLQQLQDQTRAGQEARGIATTPYGAGMETQALNNFNIDWQNNQLQRQIQGGQAAGGLYGQGAGLYGQGAGMQSGAAGQYGQVSALPYQAAQTIGGNQFGALSNLGGFGTSAAQIPQQQIQDYQNYLGWGTQQQNAGNQANLAQGQFGLNQANQAAQQQKDMFGGIGQMAAMALPFLL